MNRPKSVAKGLLAASLAAVTGASGLSAQGTAAHSQDVVRTVRVAPGRLKGKILQSGTRAPAPGRQVVIKNTAGQEVARMNTAADGTYETPALPRGNYQMTIGDGLSLDLNVTPEATISNLDIVMPPQAPVAAAPGEAAGAPKTAAAGAGAAGAGAAGAG